VDVVVEVAGGMDMEPVLRAALAAGKPVVTANKALLASKLADLGVLAQRTATPLYCEAAAAAALPILRHLSHRADEIDSLAGILNGTCNFIMTRMEQAELSLDEAVSEAQALGLTEADPTLDLSGLDAAAKLSILAYRAFGVWIHPDGFLVRGIREIDRRRLWFFKRRRGRSHSRNRRRCFHWQRRFDGSHADPWSPLGRQCVCSLCGLGGSGLACRRNIRGGRGHCRCGHRLSDRNAASGRHQDEDRQRHHSGGSCGEQHLLSPNRYRLSGGSLSRFVVNPYCLQTHRVE